MVDKRSLRSSSNANDKKKDDKKDSSDSASSSSKQQPSGSKRTTRQTAASASGQKRAASPTKKMPAPKKNPAAGDDTEMKDTETIKIAPEAPKPKKKADGDGDVEMGGSKDEKKDGEKEEKKEDPVAVAVNEIKQNFVLLERAVTLFDPRFTLRVLRHIASLRRRLTPEIIAKVVTETYPADNPSSKTLLQAIGQAGAQMDVDETDGAPKTPPSGDVLPEVDVYLHLLVQIYLLDKKENETGAKFSSLLVDKIHLLNRRTMDALAAKVYFYYSRFYELLPMPAIESIRVRLLASLRTATLRKDIDTQGTIITLLLRNYLVTSHIDQADHLVAKTSFPESAANNLIARYQYYLAKIRAIQLNYSAANEEITGALRKAPQAKAAVGFVQAATKLQVVIDLLMGDIPNRSTFREPRLQNALQAYFELVRAVRVGELDVFAETLKNHAETFKKDGLYSLILRLRQNVIKTGIRMMSLMYSKISLRDICVNLKLDSEESAEYIVAKAIRDGVIEATLDHEKGYMQSKEVTDVYATQEPQDVFHERINFCLTLHNDSVKAMRFPMNQHRLELKNAQEARERERELAKEIQDGDIDDDDAGGEFDGL